MSTVSDLVTIEREPDVWTVRFQSLDSMLLMERELPRRRATPDRPRREAPQGESLARMDQARFR